MSEGSALIVVGPGLGLALAKSFASDGHPVALVRGAIFSG